MARRLLRKHYEICSQHQCPIGNRSTLIFSNFRSCLLASI
nr:MAG TPA: finger protein [Caudoviricetes sp.]